MKKVVPTDSFFNFFKPPQPPSVEALEEGDVEEEELEALDERLEIDYQIGEDLKERVRADDMGTLDLLVDTLSRRSFPAPSTTLPARPSSTTRRTTRALTTRATLRTRMTKTMFVCILFPPLRGIIRC